MFFFVPPNCRAPLFQSCSIFYAFLFSACSSNISSVIIFVVIFLIKLSTITKKKYNSSGQLIFIRLIIFF